MTKRCSNYQPTSLDSADFTRPRNFLKLAAVIGFMITVALVALYYRNFLIILIIIAVWISWRATKKRPKMIHNSTRFCGIWKGTVVGFWNRFFRVSLSKFHLHYYSSRIRGVSSLFWCWMTCLLAISLWNSYQKGKSLLWVTSKLCESQFSGERSLLSPWISY